MDYLSKYKYFVILSYRYLLSNIWSAELQKKNACATVYVTESVSRIYIGSVRARIGPIDSNHCMHLEGPMLERSIPSMNELCYYIMEPVGREFVLGYRG